LKILIIGLNFYPELTGIGKYNGEMASFLAEKGHQIHVITSPPYYPEWQIRKGYSGLFYKKELWSGVTVYRCPILIPKKISGINRIFHLLSFSLSIFPVSLSQIFWHPDLVLAIAPALTSSPLALLTSFLSNSKSWLNIQDFEIDAALGLDLIKTPSSIKNFMFYLEHWIINQFDHLSTISTAMKTKLISKGVSPEKISLFPNWVDIDKIKPKDSSNFRKNMNIPEDTFVVLYAGNMGKKQGLEILIATAKLLVSNEKILFILCGDGANRSILENQAQGLTNVIFLPLHSVEKLNDLLNVADVHILTQKKTAADLVMPSKLSGMLASGKAVIVTANQDTEIANIINPIGFVVPPERPDMIAEKIIFLYNNPIIRHEFGEKGRSWVEQNWSKKIILGQFLMEIENFK
jgi:colanic acid biosynthesis glycosyl transferase WcaI